MRFPIIVSAGILLLTACDDRISEAKHIVDRELGAPKIIDFRSVRTKGDDSIVCGEVNASDIPGGGWRKFVAYVSVGRAAVASSDDVITSAAEMGNPALAGEAERFNHMCD